MGGHLRGGGGGGGGGVVQAACQWASRFGCFGSVVGECVVVVVVVMVARRRQEECVAQGGEVEDVPPGLVSKGGVGGEAPLALSVWKEITDYKNTFIVIVIIIN